MSHLNEPLLMTPEDRPWFGSSEKGKFRLREGDDDSAVSQLFQECMRRAETPPVIEYRGLAYIDSGWEFSVFRHGLDVIKIPAGRFAEVSDPLYFKNAERNYYKIIEHVGERFVAATQFTSAFITQERIDFRPIDRVELRTLRQPERGELVRMFSRLLNLLDQEDWLPDLAIELRHDMLEMKNWLFDRNGVPKIVDFTTYYDGFRLSARRLAKERSIRRQRLLNALNSLS